MAFRRFRLVMAEDCGLMMLQFPEASRRMVRRPVKNPAESSLLRKDVVPVVVPKLPFFGAFRKVIGEAAYPLSLGSVRGILLILLLLSIWTVVFASHCACSPSIASKHSRCQTWLRGATFDVTESTVRSSGNLIEHLMSIRASV